MLTDRYLESKIIIQQKTTSKRKPGKYPVDWKVSEMKQNAKCFQISIKQMKERIPRMKNQRYVLLSAQTIDKSFRLNFWNH